MTVILILFSIVNNCTYNCEATDTIDGQYYYNKDYNVSIIFPNNWIVKDSIINETIIKKARYEKGEDCASIMIDISEVESSGSFTSYSDQDYEKFMENVKNELSKKFKNVKTGKVIIDNKIFVKIEYDTNQESKYIGYMGFYNSKQYIIGSTQPIKLNDKLNNQIYKSIKTFKFGKRENMIESISENTSLSDVYSFSYNSILVYILLNFMLTYGVGIGVPLILRKFILKKTLTKKTAILVSFFWYIVQLTIWTLLNSSSKAHGGLMIISVLTYVIFTKEYNANKKSNDIINKY